MEDAATLALGGLCCGLVLGAAARAGRFCIMGAVEDWVLGRDTRRFRMIALAAATAIAGTALLTAAGWLDPGETRYLRTFAPGLSVVGGLMFGVGMALVGTCGFGALARAGGGDLRALVLACVIGISAYALAAGPLSPLLAALSGGEPGLPAGSLADSLGDLSGVPALWLSLGLASALAATALSDAGFRASMRHVGWAMAVGLAVVAAWAVTANVARTGFLAEPVEALSFVMPIGDTLRDAMTGGSRLPDFGVSVVLGVVLGAALASRATGDARWEACDDARELRRQILGAALMGVGGVLAVGCTIGQGLSALSVLAPSAPLVILAILLGARGGLLWLVGGSVLQR